MKRPIESDYSSHVAYTRALEAYCDSLAQPEQEPVAWMIEDRDNRHFIFRMQKPEAIVGETLTPLYTTPPKEQRSCDKRPWVKLTDDEIHDTEGYEEAREMYRFAQALEAKLKELNT